MSLARTFELGDRVTVAQTQLIGTIKFIGTTEFAAGEWMGIELDEKAGKNNGCVKGKAYFDCKPDHGLFVRPTAVTKIGQAKRRSSAAPDQALQPPKAVAPAPASPPKNPFLSVPQSPAASPSRRSSSRLEEGDRSREIQKASVQLDLAQAMEDHDVDAIRWVLPVAKNLGLPPEEIAAARRILSWELKQTMSEEVTAVQASISQLAQSVARLEGLASQQSSNDSRSVIRRLGAELEKRVLQNLEGKMEQILDRALSKAAEKTSSHPLEAFQFEQFDLNGDGVVTRDEFEEARKRILTGEVGAKPVVSNDRPEAAAKAPQEAEGRCSKERAPPAVMRYLYSRAARRLELLARHQDYQTTRCVVEHLLSKGLQRALLVVQPAPDVLAEAKEDIAAIRASKQRIEEATKKAEELVAAASTKVQAAVRGRMVRREKELVQKSTVTLQRALRRLKEQRHKGKKIDLAVVVGSARGQRKEWAMEFERAAAAHGGLEQAAFVQALVRAASDKVSNLQAEKLWMGFLEHSESGAPMKLSTFWGICEAVEQGDAQAADFADMPVDEYTSYANTRGSHEAEQKRAALRIQAAQRGRQARVQRSSQAVGTGPAAQPAGALHQSQPEFNAPMPEIFQP